MNTTEKDDKTNQIEIELNLLRKQIKYLKQDNRRLRYELELERKSMDNTLRTIAKCIVKSERNLKKNIPVDLIKSTGIFFLFSYNLEI
jgi:hypothetical protein